MLCDCAEDDLESSGSQAMFLNPSMKTPSAYSPGLMKLQSIKLPHPANYGLLRRREFVETRRASCSSAQ